MTPSALEIALGMTENYNNFGLRKIYHPKKEKACLNCGTVHTHNNSFCSATCCKEYKDK